MWDSVGVPVYCGTDEKTLGTSVVKLKEIINYLKLCVLHTPNVCNVCIKKSTFLLATTPTSKTSTASGYNTSR